jgi:hypothetical protein
LVSVFWLVTNYIPARRAYERTVRAYLLKSIGEAIYSYENSIHTLPTEIGDLKPFLGENPDAWKRLSEGEFVLDLGRLRDSATKRSQLLIGYESRVNREEAYVLMGDGAIAQMTPDEFRTKHTKGVAD